jgi:hypothetical protein
MQRVATEVLDCSTGATSAVPQVITERHEIVECR